MLQTWSRLSPSGAQNVQLLGGEGGLSKAQRFKFVQRGYHGDRVEIRHGIVIEVEVEKLAVGFHLIEDGFQLVRGEARALQLDALQVAERLGKQVGIFELL